MLKKQSAGLVLWGAILFVAWNALLLLFFWTRPVPSRLPSDNALDDDPASLTREVIRLAQDAEVELERQRGLLQQIREHHALWSQRWKVPTAAPPAQPHVPVTPPPAVIPILVIACDRSTVRRCLDKLLHYRPSAELFPIIVSQDCGHEETAQVIASYGSAVTHIRQPDLSNIAVQPDHRKFQGYYKIARHYRWALGQIFHNFNYPAAVVVEDDLEVAPDFFEYFQATYPLLKADPSLWCVSAWNDNGKEQMVDSSKPELLYRTDFFPGLGWLLLAELWAELEPKWPKAFWDDWMRRPEQRKGRACVRPEISRTMTFGRKGVSHGQFFDQHLKFIKLNQQFVAWTDGSSSKFRNWYVDEPSCGSEVCVVMYHQPSAPAGIGGPYMFQWNDDRCNMKNNFICKYSDEKPTAPSTRPGGAATEPATPILPEEAQKEDAKETFKESKEAALNLAYVLIPSVPLLLLLVVTTVVCWVWICRRRKREQPEPSTKEHRTMWPAPHQENSPDLEVYNVIRKQSEADLAETRPDLKNISFRVCSGEATPDDVSCDYDNMAVNPSESGFMTLASVESGFVTNDIYEFSPDRMGRSKESGWVENDIYGY